MEPLPRYCTSCGKETLVPAGDALTACGCGNAAWSSVPPASSTAAAAYSTIDATGAAAAALRQPGSPHFPPPA